MAGEVTSITVTENTLFNLTITEDDGTTVALSLGDPVLLVNTTMAEIDAVMVNNGTGLGVYKSKSNATFVMRSITDDNKTIDTALDNSDNEIKVKLPDVGIKTPDNFQINADSDSSANIKLVGASVDLSKAKLITDLDANSQDLDNVNLIGATTGNFTTVTATTGGITTVNATSVNASTVDINGGTIDGTVIGGTTPLAVSTTALVATTADINAGTIDNTIIGATTPVVGTFTTANATALVVSSTASVTGDVQIGSTSTHFGIATFNDDINLTNSKTATLPIISSTTANISTANITSADINGGTIDNTTVGASASSTGRFSTLSSASVALTGGVISGTDVNMTGETFTLADNQLSGDKIDGGTYSNFASTGIDDNADQTVLTIGADEVAAFGGAVTIAGNLTVSGTETILNTETINLEDNNIVLNSNHTGTPTADAGITIERGNASDAIFQWKESTDTWEAKTASGYSKFKALDGEFTGDLTVGDDLEVVGDLVVTGTTTMSVLGNTNRVVINTTDRKTSSGHGIILYDSTTVDNNLTTSNNTDDILHNDGTAQYNTSATPTIINYITNESMQIIKDPTETGVNGTTHTDITAGSINVASGMTAGGDRHNTNMTGGTVSATDGFNFSTAAFGAGLTTSYGATGSSGNWVGNHIGTTSKPFTEVHAKELFTTKVTVSGDILPEADNTRSLGSSTKQWKEVFVGPGSLYIDGHKVLGSDDSDTINFTSDTGQTMDFFAGGTSGTAGVINMASRGNTTTFNDTTVNLGPSGASGTINARGTLEAPDLHVGVLEIDANLLNNTGTNQNLEIRTNGTGYTHINTADLYVGPIAGAVKIDESSISVSNANGNLSLASNGTGVVKIDNAELNSYSAYGENFFKIKAGGTNENLMLEATNGSGYFLVKSPNQYFGAASGVKITNAAGAATTLSGFGYQSEALNIAGNVHGDIDTAVITTSTTDEDIAVTTNGTGTFNVDKLEIGDGVAYGQAYAKLDATDTNQYLELKARNGSGYVWANTNMVFLGGDSGLKLGKFGQAFNQVMPMGADGLVFHAEQASTSLSGSASPIRMTKKLNFDHSGANDDLDGNGLNLEFKMRDQAGTDFDIASNLCKAVGVQTGGSSGSATITDFHGEYTLSLGQYTSGSDQHQINALTVNKDFAQATKEIRITNTPRNSGNTNLSGLYLTYDGAETGTPTAKIKLKNQGTDTTTSLIELSEGKVDFKKVVNLASNTTSEQNALTGVAGDMLFNSTTSKFMGYNGSAWVELG